MYLGSIRNPVRVKYGSPAQIGVNHLNAASEMQSRVRHPAYYNHSVYLPNACVRIAAVDPVDSWNRVSLFVGTVVAR